MNTGEKKPLKVFNTFPHSLAIRSICIWCREAIPVIASSENVGGYVYLYVDPTHECKQKPREHEPNLTWHVEDKDQYYDKSYDEYYLGHKKKSD